MSFKCAFQTGNFKFRQIIERNNLFFWNKYADNNCKEKGDGHNQGNCFFIELNFHN